MSVFSASTLVNCSSVDVLTLHLYRSLVETWCLAAVTRLKDGPTFLNGDLYFLGPRVHCSTQQSQTIQRGDLKCSLYMTAYWLMRSWCFRLRYRENCLLGAVWMSVRHLFQMFECPFASYCVQLCLCWIMRARETDKLFPKERDSMWLGCGKCMLSL